MTKAFKQELKTLENNIYLGDNPADLQRSPECLSKTNIWNNLLFEISCFAGSQAGAFLFLEAIKSWYLAVRTTLFFYPNILQRALVSSYFHLAVLMDGVCAGEKDPGA